MVYDVDDPLPTSTLPTYIVLECGEDYGPCKAGTIDKHQSQGGGEKVEVDPLDQRPEHHIKLHHDSGKNKVLIFACTIN